MPTPLVVLPDPVLAVIQYLRARSEVTALVVSANIVSALPEVDAPAWPFILVNGMPSQGIWPSIDDAGVQIEALDIDHPTSSRKDTTSLIARTVRAAMWAIANDTVAAGVLSSCSEISGPQWIPDTTTTPPLGRVIQHQSVLLHA